MKKEELDKIVGANIKKYRMANNYTQESLAEKVGVSPSLIRNMESNKVSQGISIPILYKISKALKVSISDMVRKE